jgi:aspartate/methionine/tyrosine aminotransferase
LRCGWILSAPQVAERIRRTRDVVDGTGSIVSERLAVVAFTHLGRLLQRSASLLATNGAIVRDFLSRRQDLDVASSSGTVVFPRVARMADTSSFAERLLTEHETAVVPGRFFQSPAHIRVGFGGPTDAVRAGLGALGAALDALGGV